MLSGTEIKNWLSTIKNMTSGGALAFMLNILLVADILLTHFGYKPLYKIVTWSEAAHLSTPAHVIIFMVAFGATYLFARVIAAFFLFFIHQITPSSDGFTSHYSIMSKAVKDNNEVLFKVLDEYSTRRSIDIDLFYHFVVLALLVLIELFTPKGSLIHLFGYSHAIGCLFLSIVLVVWANPKMETFRGEYQVPVGDDLTNGNGNRTGSAVEAASLRRLDKEHQERSAEHVIGVAAPTIQDNLTNKQDGVFPPTL